MAELEKADLTGHTPYRFTQTLFGEKETEIATFDPTKDNRWTLISIDGQSPTKKQLKKFEKKKERQEKRGDDTDRFTDIITPGTVIFREENTETITLQFAPQLDDLPEKSQEFVQGIAVLTKPQKSIQTLRIFSKEPFSPILSVTMETFDMKVQFGEFHGQALPTSLSFRMKGRAAIKDFDIESLVQYTNIETVTDI